MTKPTERNGTVANNFRGKSTIDKVGLFFSKAQKVVWIAIACFFILAAIAYAWPQRVIMTVVCGREPVIGSTSNDTQTYALPGEAYYNSYLTSTFYCTEQDAIKAGLRHT